MTVATMDKRSQSLVGRKVYVVDGARTPFIKAQGRPGPFSAADLAVAVGQGLLQRQAFTAQQLDEVIVGCVIPSAKEANVARVISLRLGCGEKVPAWTVQRNCASGMQALATAAERIAAGYSDLILAGGTESMSQAPVMLNPLMVNWLADWRQARNFSARMKVLSQLRGKHLRPEIALLQGLTDPTSGFGMGQTAENLASQFNITREQMDQFALESHRRLAGGIDGHQYDEIIPLYTPDGRCVTEDEGLRRDGDMAGLSRLKAAFDRPFGRVTAGNSAQITDGAALLLLASEEAVERYQLPILGQIVDQAWSGLAPEQMGLGPVYAMDRLLSRKKNLVDIDLWEINEAFAAQVLACLAALDDVSWQLQHLGEVTVIPMIDPQKLNVDGGSLAIGHPVGASGARIVLHLLKALHQRGGGNGVASLCIGGGQGGAMLVSTDGGRS